VSPPDVRAQRRTERLALPELSELEVGLRRGLVRHVHALAGEIGERQQGRPAALAAAADSIADALVELGYAVRPQRFSSDGVEVSNLETELPGSGLRDEIVVVGAHYDTVPGSPGANDNGTGVAALLELAAQLRTTVPQRTLRLVAFVNEEPPYFQTDAMGSLVYARRSRARHERVVAMLSLETIGFYSDLPGSQLYPVAPLGLLYPDRGDFVALIGNLHSRALVKQLTAAFRRATPFPVEGVALPALVPGVGWSDHWAFWHCGFPAAMVTDTAPFRYPHYHGPGDTPDRVDYDRAARVVAGVLAGVRDLLGLPPLQSTASAWNLMGGRGS
jgi:hypothetical protein